MKLTKAQRAVLERAARGGVQRGSWGRSQHHRACYKLQEAGLLVQGRVPLSETSFVARFLGGVPSGLGTEGWTITDAGRRALEGGDG